MRVKFRGDTLDAQMRFERLWWKAQKKNDVTRMELLLQPRWLSFWWRAFMRVEFHLSQPFRQTVISAIERILTELGYVEQRPERPERPSERAMRMAESMIVKKFETIT